MLWSLTSSSGARTTDDLRAGLSCDGMLETAGGDLQVVFAAVLSADKAAMSWIGGVVRPGFRGSHILELLVRSFLGIASSLVLGSLASCHRSRSLFSIMLGPHHVFRVVLVDKELVQVLRQS